MTNFPPIIVHWLVFLTHIYIYEIELRARFSKISIIHNPPFVNYLLFESIASLKNNLRRSWENICETFVYNKSTLMLHDVIRRKKKNEKSPFLEPSSYVYPHYENAGTRVFGSGNTWTLEIVIERHLMKHPVHEYTYVRHVRGDFRSYLSGEKRKWYHTSLTVAATPVYRLTLEAHAWIHRPRLRSEPRRKGHFGPVTDAFAGEEDRQIS